MELHEYQKRLANFIASHPHSIISVDMGLGKTAAVLAWMSWYCRRKQWQCGGVVVAPKRVAENNWQQEAMRWGLTELARRMVIVAGTPAKRRAALQDTSHPVKIISRDNLRDITNWRCDFVVLDELTSFKNVEAQRTKIVTSIVAPIKVGLTGTFLANGAIDIYGQCAAVGVDMGYKSFYAWRGDNFRDAMAGSGQAFHKWVLRQPLEEVLRPISRDVFTLTAADYLTIPPVKETTHKIDVGEEIREAILDLDSFLSVELDGQRMSFDERQKFTKLQTLCDGFVYAGEEAEPKRGERSLKLEAVADFVADCKDQGESVLLFYAFREEADWLTEMLTRRGVRSCTVNDRAFLDKWNGRQVDCLIAHPASAGHGLNLQHGGRIIVWSTLTYNYELFAQGNARLARQGQRSNVQIHYFIADKTCEERAVQALQRKQGQQNEFLTLTKQ